MSKPNEELIVVGYTREELEFKVRPLKEKSTRQMLPTWEQAELAAIERALAPAQVERHEQVHTSMELLGMSEAARRLKVHPFTLRRWSEAGKVKPMRDSAGRRLFLGEDIAQLVKERAAAAGIPGGCSTLKGRETR